MTYKSSGQYYNSTAAPAAPKKPTVFLTPLVHQKLLGFARLCSVEISGMGFVKVLPENRGFLVTDLICPPQKGTGGGTELDPQKLAEIVGGWIAEGKEHLNEELRCWWH